VLVIRHASAGDPEDWEGDDRLRPLDAKGFEQAGSLVELVDGYMFTRVLLISAVRFMKKVYPHT